MSSKAEEVIKELFESLLKIYIKKLEKSKKGSEFIFDSVDALYYDLNKIRLSRDGSYIDSPEWMKNKKAIINPQNEKDDECFQYAFSIALNHEQIKNHLEKIPNIKPFIDQYNWKFIDFPTSFNLWKVLKSNNKSFAPNILFAPHNTKEIRHAYKSKYNLKRENQVILLMIADGEKWHYLAVKNLSALLRVIIMETCIV